MLPVEDEPLLVRTIRLAAKHRHQGVPIFRNGQTVPIELDTELRISVTKSTCQTAHAVLSLALPESPLRILLGDVFYTEEAMAKIMAEKKTRFFGDGQDIFAITVSPTDFLTFGLALVAGMISARNNGRLWEAYRDMFSLPKCPLQAPAPGFAFIGDRTQDFDTPEEYDDFLKGVSKNILYRATQPQPQAST